MAIFSCTLFLFFFCYFFCLKTCKVFREMITRTENGKSGCSWPTRFAETRPAFAVHVNCAKFLFWTLISLFLTTYFILFFRIEQINAGTVQRSRLGSSSVSLGSIFRSICYFSEKVWNFHQEMLKLFDKWLIFPYWIINCMKKLRENGFLPSTDL